MPFNPREGRVVGGGDTRRAGNAGRLLAAAADAFVRDKLEAVAAGGFAGVAQVHMALIQNLDLDGTRLTRVAARAGMTKQSMLELVDKVAALGLVERRPDPVDGRAKIVAFTPDGLRMLDRLRHGVARAERRMEDAVGATFLAEMKEVLSAYVPAAAGEAVAGEAVAGDLLMPAGDPDWRMRNAGRVLVAASRVFHGDVAAGLRAAGFADVPEVQLTLVRELDVGGTRLTELAARARMTKQAMAELVDKTVASGLMVRASDPIDRRARVIMFTLPGVALLAALRGSVEAAERRLAEVAGQRFVARLKARLAGYVASVDAPGRSSDARS